MCKLILKYTVGTVIILMISFGFAVAKDTDKAAESGKKLFINYGCYQCHGYEGQGGFSGPRIAPTLYPLKTFMGLVRKPTGTMPAFSPRVLADRDLEKIHAYVASIPEPPPLQGIPALSKRSITQK